MPEPLNLTLTADFYIRLLSQPHQWRRRHEIDVVCGSAGHVRTTSRFLVDFEESLFEDYLDPAEVDRIKVFAPLGTRAKGPLLNPTFEGPFGPAHVSRRSHTSSMAAEYLTQLASTSADEVVDGLPWDLLRSICLYSPDAYREHDREGTTREAAVLAFLEERRGASLPGVDARRVRGWLDQLEPAAETLCSRLGEPADDASSSENVLLAIAHMRDPPSGAGIDALVRNYERAVRAADDADDDELLVQLAEYGRRYELVLEVELPTSGSATIAVSEDNRIEWKRLRRLGYQFAAGVAETVHLDFRVVDPAVSVAGETLRDANGEAVEGRHYDALRRIGTEVVNFYSSVDDRPDPVTLDIELKAGDDLRWTARWLVGLNVLAILGLLALSVDGISGDEAAVLVVPTTLAATFALFREQSTLATRLLKWPRLVTALSIVAVLVVAFAVLMLCGEDADPADISSRVNLDGKSD